METYSSCHRCIWVQRVNRRLLGLAKQAQWWFAKFGFNDVLSELHGLLAAGPWPSYHGCDHNWIWPPIWTYSISCERQIVMILICEGLYSPFACGTTTKRAPDPTFTLRSRYLWWFHHTILGLSEGLVHVEVNQGCEDKKCRSSRYLWCSDMYYFCWARYKR